MKINSEVSVGLKRLSNSALVSDSNFNLILSSVCDLFSKRKQKHVVDIDRSEAKIEVLKESYSALLCFLVDCVRKGRDEEAVSSYLESARFSPDKVDQLLGLYLDCRRTLLGRLRSYGLRLPALMNVSWKINYCVKSSFSGLEGSSVYYITLDVREGSGSLDERNSAQRKITFLCSVEHLQELASGLRAAVRKLEALAAATDSLN